jgi:uncharacterized membrane-anchored protein YitT (DUF2179 family)
MNMFKKMNKKVKNFIFINIGVMGLALSFSFFLSPFDLVTGGIGGIAINILNILERFGIVIDASNRTIVESAIMMGVNLLLLFISLFLIGKEFFFKTLYCTVAYPIYSFLFGELARIVKFTELLPVENNNIGGMLIIVLFSALLSGVSIGIAIKYGASTGGIDIVEQVMFKYFNVPYSTTLFVCDGITIIIASILSMNLLPICYGAIYVWLMGKLIDSVVFGGFRSYSVSIITSKPDIIKAYILENINRGLTIVEAVGGYTGNDLKMIICVMTSSEVSEIRGNIKSLDENAFMYITQTSEVSGIGFTKDR